MNYFGAISNWTLKQTRVDNNIPKYTITGKLIYRTKWHKNSYGHGVGYPIALYGVELIGPAVVVPFPGTKALLFLLKKGKSK